jgi:hypothetical protein
VVDYDGNNVHFTFGLPRGANGTNGTNAINDNSSNKSNAVALLG